MKNSERIKKNKRFFASDLKKVEKEIKNTFLEDFTMKDEMKLNKQDPLVLNVIVPVIPKLPNDPVLSIAIQNNGQVKEKGKEKEKVEKLIGREVRKKFQNYGYFIGNETSFDDPYYERILTFDGDE